MFECLFTGVKRSEPEGFPDSHILQKLVVDILKNSRGKEERITLNDRICALHVIAGKAHNTHGDSTLIFDKMKAEEEADFAT